MELYRDTSNISEKKTEIYFIYSANIEEIKEALSWGCISGVTINPESMSNEKEGCSFKEKILEIVELVKKPVCAEVTKEDYEDIVKEAKKYASWNDNIVINIPWSIEGLRAVTRLENFEGVRTNVTAITATNQATFGSLPGPSYASIFYGSISDMGYDPVQVIKEISTLYKELNIKTKLIVGSIRTMIDVNSAFYAGADIVTVPLPILKEKFEK